MISHDELCFFFIRLTIPGILCQKSGCTICTSPHRRVFMGSNQLHPPIAEEWRSFERNIRKSRCSSPLSASCWGWPWYAMVFGWEILYRLEGCLRCLMGTSSNWMATFSCYARFDCQGVYEWWRWNPIDIDEETVVSGGELPKVMKYYVVE